jgi:two-component system sensor kinase FixL
MAFYGINPLKAKGSGDAKPLARHLVALCLALILPIIVLGGMLAWSYAEAERARLEHDALEIAHEVVAATDRELSDLIATTKVLAVSRSLQRGDLDTFDAQARDVYQQIGINIVLRDLQSHQLVNTRLPKGALLPTNVETESDKAVIETKRPFISNLFIGAVTRKPLFIVNVPVLRDGEIVYFLNLSLEPERMREVILQARLPENWTASVADRRGFVVAHSSRQEEMLNQQLPLAIWRAAAVRDGTITGENPTGEHDRVLIAFTRSQLSGWIAAVTVPHDQIVGPMRRLMMAVAGIGSGILVISLGLALIFARRIKEPVAALAVQAATLGKTKAAKPLETRLTEVNELSKILLEEDSERQAAESALRASEERYRILASATHEGVAVHDRSRLIEANEAFWRMFGYPSRAQIVGKRGLRLIAPTARKAVLAQVRSGSLNSFEAEGRRTDSTTFPINLSCGPVVYHGRRMQIVVVRDLSCEKAAEKSLKDSEARLQLAQSAGRIGTWEWDVQNARAVCSESYRQLYGLDPKGPGHQTPEDWLAQVHPEDRDRVLNKWQSALDSGQLENEYRIIRPDGSVRWVFDRGVPIFDTEGPPTRFIGVNVDVTERKESEQRLGELQLELLHASRLSAMGQMAAALAHELNQPLGAAANFMSAARFALKGDKAAAERASARIDKAIEQTVRAGAILSRLRDYIAKGEIDKRITNARQLLQDAVELALVGAKDPTLRVRFDFEDRDRELLVDRIQIQQVAFNLVRNAIEATEGKKVREIIVATRSAAEDELEISVADTGSGLPDDPETVFQPFVTSKTTGMGVGLSICRTIVNAHGGRLWAEARTGGGAVFRFTLPTAIPREIVYA